MDWTSVIVAVVTALGSFLGVYYANRKSQAIIGYRIDQLEKKMDKHNQVIERVYRLEEAQAVTDEKIRVANHRIDDLESMQKKKGA